MRLHIRRMKMDDWPNRKDVQWVLFEEGKLSQPICIMSDIEWDRLVGEADEQDARHESEAT